MGVYVRYIRPGKVLEMLPDRFRAGVAAVFGGRGVAQSAWLAPLFTFSGVTLTKLLIGYGFLASVLPVWLLLAPRGYLSTFVKLGVVILLAIGVVFLHPELKLPPLTRFIDGTGPIFAGKIFPFLLYYHRLRSGFRISRADFLGNHAQAAGQGAACDRGRLRLHAARKPGGDDGPDRRRVARSGRVFRGEFAGGSGRLDTCGRRRHHLALGFPGDRRRRCSRWPRKPASRRCSIAPAELLRWLWAWRKSSPEWRRGHAGAGRVLVSLRHHV